MRGKGISIGLTWTTTEQAIKILGLLVISAAIATTAWAADPPHQQAARIVAQIQRADYEGDRAALKILPLKLLPFVGRKELTVQIRYWRAFALWRRAINGFNESPTPTDIEADLQDAIAEFEKAIAHDPDFADAKIGMASCLGNILYLHRKDESQVQTYVARISPLLQDLKASAADNPRLYWVLGPMYWSLPINRGGGQDKAFEAYQRGLELMKNQGSTASDPLLPTWGEPELLMNLAWSNLNRTAPDLDAAQQYAQSALRLMPYWHYVRDILMPQILEAKAKATKD
jgi:tetratricopeptide (TPR) repeat protein